MERFQDPPARRLSAAASCPRRAARRFSTCGVALALLPLVASACAQPDAMEPTSASATEASSDLESASDVGSDASSESESAARDFTELDQVIETFLADKELDGATVAVVHIDDGVVLERGYGSFAADRISLVASSSKMLSAGILAHLDHEGSIDLDAPIAQYLAQWGDYKTDITTAQLLSNSAGMTGLVEDPTYAPYLCQFLGKSLQECAKEIYTADDVADRVPPDTAFRYGGGQWQLAGGVAEMASGQTWAELVDETYVQPCDLGVLAYVNHYAPLFLDGGLDAALTYPSSVDGDVSGLQATDNPNIEGGAYTTAPDLARVLLMHLRGGTCGDRQVMAPETVRRMRQDRIREKYDGTSIDETLPGYGIGWWLERDAQVAVAGGAYGSMPWIDDDRGYAAVIILEADFELGRELRLAAKPVLDGIFDP